MQDNEVVILAEKVKGSELPQCVHQMSQRICRAMTRPPRPSSTAECLRLIAHLREEQASAASWEPRPPFEAAEMD